MTLVLKLFVIQINDSLNYNSTSSRYWNFRENYFRCQQEEFSVAERIVTKIISFLKNVSHINVSNISQ